MARITNKKYNYMAKSLTELLADVDKHVGKTWFADNCPNAIRLVQNAHNRVQTRKVREMAKELEDMTETERFNSSLFENPSYYGYGRNDDESIRGQNLKTVYKAMGNIESNYYWEDFGGSEYWMTLDRKRFIQSIQDHIEYGNAPKDLQLIENPSKRDLDSIEWGDETIMSMDEWDRLDEFMMDNDIDYNGQSDLIWHEVGGFDRATEINIVNEIDGSHSRWNGWNEDEDCILYRLEALHQEQPLAAMLVAEQIDRIIANTKNSWGRRYLQCEKVLAKAEYDSEE